ncbi:hypothetical protein N8628_00645 [Verrucomicrobia bacterium]|nr:hypothetical protein [Verrucomicrobiota bacterium]
MTKPVFLIFILQGCQTTGPAKRLIVFDPSEHEPYLQKGDCNILGQAFLKTRSGYVKYGAGNKVVLWPQTSYTTESRVRGTLGGTRLEPTDPRLAKYGWKTVADGSGNFEFKDLPIGSYYIACAITWEVAGDYGMRNTGALAIGEATVSESEKVVKVVVTR